MVYECKKGHQFESEPSPNGNAPKICPTCEEARMRYSRTRFLHNLDRKNRSLEDRGISTDDRARRCEGCNGLLKGMSHLEHDDATGQKFIECDRCSHQHEFVQPLSRWE